MSDSLSAPPPSRHSRCLEEARQGVQRRTGRLDGRQRILLALRLGRRARLLAAWREPEGG